MLPLSSLLNNAEARLQNHDIATAKQLLLEIIAREPRHFSALAHLILLAFSSREVELGKQYVQRVLHPECEINNFALLLHLVANLNQLSRFADAQAIATKKLPHCPNQQLPQLRWLIVQAALQSRDTKTAVATLIKLLADDKNNPQLKLTYANTLAQQGVFEQAVNLYKEVLQLQPTNSFACAGLVKCQKVAQSDSGLMQHFKTAIDGNSDAISKARVYLAKAKYLNDIGEFRDAWQAALTGNKLKRQAHPFNNQALQAQVDKTLAVFTPQHAGKEHSSNHHPHVLVVGMPRSGTTLVEQILASIEGYYAGGETPAIEHALQYGRHGFYYMDPLSKEEPLDYDVMASAYEEYFSQFCHYQGQVIVNKVPTNFFHIGIFKSLFPKSKIINLQRHPLDVATSIFFENFSAHFSYTNDLEDIFAVYEQYQRLMAHWRTLYPEDILDLSYQQLVTDYASTSQQVGDFLGHRLPDAKLIRESHNPVETPSIWQVRQPINTHAIGRWQHYAEQFTDYQSRYSE